ncbi:collagen alpha-1(I) chain-like [Elephas maximus indicus]|uniref:collagen alpha-1(I) chain-like n=1 Tax=Elephas maximus indicus TaxID=99487 RepID=UPI0021168719|nr:collagen alpha-1(I) chain-like [Elephas maximus indicus]
MVTKGGQGLGPFRPPTLPPPPPTPHPPRQECREELFSRWHGGVTGVARPAAPAVDILALTWGLGPGAPAQGARPWAHSAAGARPDSRLFFRPRVVGTGRHGNGGGALFEYSNIHDPRESLRVVGRAPSLAQGLSKAACGWRRARPLFPRTPPPAPPANQPPRRGLGSHAVVEKTAGWGGPGRGPQGSKSRRGELALREQPGAGVGAFGPKEGRGAVHALWPRGHTGNLAAPQPPGWGALGGRGAGCRRGRVSGAVSAWAWAGRGARREPRRRPLQPRPGAHGRVRRPGSLRGRAGGAPLLLRRQVGPAPRPPGREGPRAAEGPGSPGCGQGPGPSCSGGRTLALTRRGPRRWLRPEARPRPQGRRDLLPRRHGAGRGAGRARATPRGPPATGRARPSAPAPRAPPGPEPGSALGAPGPRGRHHPPRPSRKPRPAAAPDWRAARPTGARAGRGGADGPRPMAGRAGLTDGRRGGACAGPAEPSPPPAPHTAAQPHPRTPCAGPAAPRPRPRPQPPPRPPPGPGLGGSRASERLRRPEGGAGEPAGRAGRCAARSGLHRAGGDGGCECPRRASLSLLWGPPNVLRLCGPCAGPPPVSLALGRSPHSRGPRDLPKLRPSPFRSGRYTLQAGLGRRKWLSTPPPQGPPLIGCDKSRVPKLGPPVPGLFSFSPGPSFFLWVFATVGTSLRLLPSTLAAAPALFSPKFLEDTLGVFDFNDCQADP